MRILAVDDEPFILELMPMLAAKVGFPNVATAVSGHLALESLHNSTTAFDCLVFDINMPEMDGIELCGRVRQIPSYRKTPIIMLTAMSDRNFIDAAFKAGATDYATKPLDISELGARFRVAQELMLARRAYETAQMASGHDTSHTHSFNLADAHSFDGIDGLIDFDSFRNYLTQISRAGLGVLQLIAVQIDQIKEVYDKTEPDDFVRILYGAANAINKAFRETGCLFTYTGNGAFLAAFNIDAPLISDEIEKNVQRLLDSSQSGNNIKPGIGLTVSAGTPIHPMYGEVADVPSSMERALLLAESRSETKRG